MHQLAILDRVLITVVEILHISIDIVLLADLGSQSIPQVVSPIIQRLRILVLFHNFVYSSSLFTIEKRGKICKRNNDKKVDLR